jgi:hypothetical protein
MSTPQHSAHAYIIGKAIAPFLPEWIHIVHSIISAVPDFTVYIQTIIFIIREKEYKVQWSWYLNAHNEWVWMRFIPGWGLHILLDNHTHKIGERWWIWNERMYWEVIGWVVFIGWLYIINTYYP